jgi:hypothetical protein
MWRCQRRIVGATTCVAGVEAGRGNCRQTNTCGGKHFQHQPPWWVKSQNDKAPHLAWGPFRLRSGRRDSNPRRQFRSLCSPVHLATPPTRGAGKRGRAASLSAPSWSLSLVLSVSVEAPYPVFTRQKAKTPSLRDRVSALSGRRDSNPRRQPWQTPSKPFPASTRRYKYLK